MKTLIIARHGNTFAKGETPARFRSINSTAGNTALYSLKKTAWPTLQTPWSGKLQGTPPRTRKQKISSVKSTN